MKKITIIIAILMLSLLLLTACNVGKKKTSTTGFVGGSDGINAEITIESISGGNRVFDAGVDPFKIDITLQNEGEFNVEEGKVLITLDGISFVAFSITQPTKLNALPLLGLRKEATGVTEASQTIVQYDANYKPDEDADRLVNLAANFCYEYETISRVTDLCLKKRVTGPSSDTACKIDEEKLVENSGAPFKVTTVSERPAGEQKVNVFLAAENVGQGTLYRPAFLSKGECVSNDEDKNKMYVKVELLDYLEQSSSIVSCSGLEGNKGEVTVIQDKIQLSCGIDTSSLTQESAFETPLRVTFSYVYKDAVSTTLTLKSSI